jgi:hypothetical protein
LFCDTLFSLKCCRMVAVVVLWHCCVEENEQNAIFLFSVVRY